MPYPRPVSPCSLETCEPSADDVIGGDLPASDDELNHSERAAKYQRIEKLAESYLHGRPLFILSASLKGPFDRSWTNPWKKDRRSIGNRKADKGGTSSRATAGPVVQETVSRQEKRREETATAEPITSPPASSHTAVPIPLPSTSDHKHKLSARKRSRQVPADDEAPRTTLRASKRQKETTMSQTAGPSSSLGDSKDWLKKDRRRINFTQFEPPSSPTSKVASRQTEVKARANVSRTMNVRGSATPLRSRGTSMQPASDATDREGLVISSVNVPDPTGLQQASARQSPALLTTERGSLTEPSLSSNAFSPADMAASFRVVSSTSQLPRFEYRRWPQEVTDAKMKKDDAAHHSSQAPPNPASKQQTIAVSTLEDDSRRRRRRSLPVEDPAMRPSTNMMGTSDRVRSPQRITDEPAQIPEESPAAESHEGHSVGLGTEANEKPAIRPIIVDHHAHPKLAEDAGRTSRTVNEPETSMAQTEHNTLDNLPFAQHIPTHPGISYRIPSLCSTALPKLDTAEAPPENTDTQLSTQAALLQAQRSFQEDLDSPEPDFPPLAEPEDTILEPHEESLLARETPYNNSARFDQAPQRSSGVPLKERMQAMSTQYIIDSVTPYTFSTEKKTRPASEIWSGQPKQPPETEEPQGMHPVHLPPHINSSPLRDRSNVAPVSSYTSDPQVHPVLTHRSTSQGTLLPFALSGSTPATAQDAQVASQGPDSFDLSQAIADAGSWLQQSFDFMKEIGRPSQPAKPS
ncbi:hypothetical protein N7539_003490 [Penicillium diatomitis]|uniref:Protamine P1 n=1 Tax=Penicillium diatomitis TaxID=2819901 RepID=A0A9W9XC10_9EURO|nr:uncharacterized protein N7539_003490 [Penicillium diatomitis]KAJ5488600.1 hypothetical protein N7539_003490 [Penicillium diatomitis]